MKQSDHHGEGRGEDWIGAWIRQQRERLQQQAAQPDAATEADLANLQQRWLEIGKAFSEGLQRFGAQATVDREAAALNPFDVSQSMLDAWSSAGIFQAGVAESAADLLRRLPPIGLAREQTESWRELAAAHAQCRHIEQELRSVLVKVQLDALDLLHERIRTAEEPIDNFRALYDLWVECGEQVYGAVAHSEAYSKLQAELGNATMRLRARLQKVIEHGLKQLDLPTRSELNSLHRQVREMTLKLEALEAARASARPRTAPRARAVRKSKAAKK